MKTRTISKLILTLSILIASVAAYFSITGLSHLFSAEMFAVIIMASVLEAGKVGATFAIHHYWTLLPYYIKIPATLMVIILMLITSMGIFGFLSKGYLTQGQPIIELQSKIDQLDVKILQHKNSITPLQNQLNQINNSFDKLLTLDKVSKSIELRKQSKQEIDDLSSAIKIEEDTISQLQNEKFPIQQSMSKFESELGPIKYVAQLLQIDLNDNDGKGKAVRCMILLLMIAFDPLAIVLIMFYDWLVQLDEREHKVSNSNNPIVDSKTVEDDIVDIIRSNPELVDENLMEDIKHNDILVQKLASKETVKPTPELDKKGWW